MEQRNDMSKPHQSNSNKRQGHGSSRRRRAIRRRRILIGIIVLCLLVLAGGIVLFMNLNKKKSASKETAAAANTATTSTSKAQNIKIDNTASKDSPKDKENESDSSEKTTSEDIPDRSSFAVDPSVPVGSDKSNGEKTVYLTFDDGPSYNTQKVLDILDEYDAKATFFVTGINSEYFDLIKTEYDKGHTIGLHTYSHDYAAVYASQDAYFKDLKKIGKLVKEQIGYVPCFIRFPGGSSNTISANYTQGIMTALSTAVQEKGYQYYDWNISCGDGGNCSAKKLRKQATSVDYTNIVLLMHDANGKETTVEALPKIIKHYQKLGYAFKAIDRETFDAHHGIGN